MNVEDIYRLLRTDHVQAQGIVDTVADPLIVLDDQLRILNASRSFFDTFKVDRYEMIGKLIYDVGNGQWDIPDLRHLLMQVIPKATAVIDYQVEHDFPGLGRRVMLLTARTLFHPDNTGHSLLLSIVDITERSRRDTAKEMLFDELRHRMKNLLMVVQSIARQTTTQGRSAEEYRDTFLGRFTALVGAQEIAFAERQETDLAALIEGVLAPYIVDQDAVVLKPGKAVVIGPTAIMSLGLILHELATNAVKYGSLSVEGGQVHVSWQVEDDPRQLQVEWVETGGPTVTAPSATGYGSKVIRMAAAYTIGGGVEQNFAPGGLEAAIVIPLAACG